MNPMRRLLKEWRALSPSERGKLRTGAAMAGSVLLSVAARRLLATAATAVVASASTVAIADQAMSDDARPFEPMAHAALSSEVPAGTMIARDPQARAVAIADSQDAAEETTSGPDEVADPRTLAAPFQRGCKTSPVRNHSSRNGARPALLVAHYTVSPNRPGWDDVDGIVSYFDQSRSQASSSYVIDFEGNCAYIVSEATKPWTQGFFNPWSISIEFIATGTERVWPEAALRKGALVFADAAKRWGIPIQPAVTSGCKIVRAGITDHDALGCGNNHTDVKPHFPMAKFVRYVQEAAGPTPTPGPLSRPYRVCSWKPPAPPNRRVCANAADPPAAVALRLKRGHSRVNVSSRR